MTQESKTFLKRALIAFPVAMAIECGAAIGLNKIPHHRRDSADLMQFATSFVSMLVLYALLTYASWPRYRRARWKAQGRCLNCGYDLKATPDRCPECGKVVERTEDSKNATKLSDWSGWHPWE